MNQDDVIIIKLNHLNSIPLKDKGYILNLNNDILKKNVC